MFDNENKEFSEHLVAINRVAKVVKGGRRFGFAAIMIVGDNKGRVGCGTGKAKEVPEAVRKASENAKNKMIRVNLKENRFLGSDLFIDFNDSVFGNNQNNPRLKGNSVVSEKNETKVYKGNFTTCKQEDGKCPPWNIYAEEVVHKKKEKRIEYKNAWLKVYDVPILYFPDISTINSLITLNYEKTV